MRHQIRWNRRRIIVLLWWRRLLLLLWFMVLVVVVVIVMIGAILVQVLLVIWMGLNYWSCGYSVMVGERLIIVINVMLMITLRR